MRVASISSRLDKVPDSLSWPLQREVMSPSARLGATRDADPVQRLVSLFGLDVWLVTGDAESREVLSDTASYSTDIRPYMGKSGSTTDGDIGGLGFTDPPDHTRLRRLLTPEFTMRRLARLRPGIESIIERQLGEIEAAGRDAEIVDLVPTFAFPIPFLVICDVLGLPDEKRETFSRLATARFDLTHGGPGSIGAIGGSREFLLAEAARQRSEPRSRADRPDHPRARRRDQRLRARRSRRRGVHRWARDQRVDARAGHRGAPRGP